MNEWISELSNYLIKGLEKGGKEGSQIDSSTLVHTVNGAAMLNVEHYHCSTDIIV
jgi:hypothetical protein